MIYLNITILLFSLSFGCWLYQLGKKRYEVWRWQRHWGLYPHLLFLQDLYRDVDGFQLSKQARQENDSIEFTYGEIDIMSFIAIMSLCRPHSNTVFYDLGSGVGKTVIACAIVFRVKKSCGIELFAPLHEAASLQKQRLKNHPSYQQHASTIRFLQKNFFEVPLLDASIIFVNAATFIADTWLHISAFLEQTQAGTLVITTKALRSNCFGIYAKTKARMSWGIVDIIIQVRLPPQTVQNFSGTVA